ncbi:MAG: methyltransferase domain-containing protein [Clostridia bacterium]|nr:methyltransferase domain-containing protein [Clostridia bacterium]
MESLHEERVDVFISFKNTDFSGNKTRDAEIARQLYEELTTRKVATFYSSTTLLSLGQAVYKKSIDEALESTKVLVVVSTDIKFLESEWVKYEWESFHQDILSGMKKNAQIVPYFASFTREQTPRSLRDLQTFNIDNNSISEVADFVVNSLSNIALHNFPHGVKNESDEGLSLKSNLSHKKVRASLYASDAGKEYDRLKVQAKNTHWCDMTVLNKVISKIDRNPIWVLDIGCAYNYVGNMRFSNMPNVRVLGVDISEKCLEFAEKTSDKQKFTFAKIDLEDPFMEEQLREVMASLNIEKFDIMFGALLLLHLKKPVTVLKKLRKFLADDGYMVVRGSDDGSVIALNDDGLVRKIIDKCNNTVGFSDRQNGRKLYNQLVSAGYKDVKVETFLKDLSGKDIDERDELFFERFSYRINYYDKILKADPTNEQKRSDYLFMKYALEELEETFANQDFWYCEHDFIAYGKK